MDVSRDRFVSREIRTSSSRDPSKTPVNISFDLDQTLQSGKMAASLQREKGSRTDPNVENLVGCYLSINPP